MTPAEMRALAWDTYMAAAWRGSMDAAIENNSRSDTLPITRVDVAASAAGLADLMLAERDLRFPF